MANEFALMGEYFGCEYLYEVVPGTWKVTDMSGHMISNGRLLRCVDVDVKVCNG